MGASDEQPQLTVSVDDSEWVVTRDQVAILGRSSSCDIAVANRHVSREHLEFRYEDGSWRGRDLGTANGTFVEGEPSSEFAVEALTIVVVGGAEGVVASLVPNAASQSEEARQSNADDDTIRDGDTVIGAPNLADLPPLGNGPGEGVGSPEPLDAGAENGSLPAPDAAPVADLPPPVPTDIDAGLTPPGPTGARVDLPPPTAENAVPDLRVPAAPRLADAHESTPPAGPAVDLPPPDGSSVSATDSPPSGAPVLLPPPGSAPDDDEEAERAEHDPSAAATSSPPPPSAAERVDNIPPPPEFAPQVQTPADWYPDPHQPGRMRYWDGKEWTDHYHTP